MYKHNANSIKETNEKMFISKNDKILFDSYETTKRRYEDTYSKSDIDNVISELDVVNIDYVINDDITVFDENYRGFANIQQIKGRTVQNQETLELSAVGNPLDTGEYEITLKSSTGKNLLDLSRKAVTEHDFAVLYNDDSTVERYGQRGLIVKAGSDNTRRHAIITFPSYPVDLYVKVNVKGYGRVCSKTLDDTNVGFNKYTTSYEECVKFTIPANSIHRKIEMDAGGSCDSEVIYDNIIISTTPFTSDEEWYEYQCDEIKIISPVQLHGDNSESTASHNFPVYDNIFVENGFLCINKNIKKVKINDIIDHSKYEIFSEDTFENTYRINLIIETGVTDTYTYAKSFTVCDKLPTLLYTLYDKELILMEDYNPRGERYAYIKLLKSRVNEYKGATYRDKIINCIKDLDMTLYYETRKPEIIKLQKLSKTDLQIFENTSIFTESFVKPSEIKLSVPINNIGTTINNNITEIDILERDVQNLEKLSKESTVDVTMDSHMIEINSTPSILDDFTIEGKTYVNLLPSLDKVSQKDNVEIPITRPTPTSIALESIDGSQTGHVFAFISERYLKTLKPDTTYTLVLNISENTTSRFIIWDSGLDSNGVEVGPYIGTKIETILGEKGIISTVVRTKTDISNKKLAFYLPRGVNGRIVIEEMALYEGDITNEITLLDNETVMASVANNSPLKITSETGENLFDGEYSYGYICDNVGYIHNSDSKRAISSLSYISCTPNDKYIISHNDDDNTIEGNVTVYFYDHSKKYLGYNHVKVLGSINYNKRRYFIVPDNAKLMRFSIYNSDSTYEYELNYNISISKVENNVDYYTEREFNSVSIDLSKYGVEGGLKSLPDGKRDRIFKKDGKYYIEQVAGYVKLTSDMNTFVASSNNSIAENILVFMYRKLENPDMLSPYTTPDEYQLSNIRTGVLPAVTPMNTINSTPMQGISVYTSTVVSDGELRMAIPKSELSSYDIAGFKQWLEHVGGMEVIYELAEPRIIEIEENLDLLLYQDRTVLSVDSGHITPIISFKLERHIQSVFNNMMKRVNELEKEQADRIKLILNSTYTADFSLHKTMLMTMSERGLNSIDDELISIIKSYILLGEFNREELENQIDLFTMIDKIDFKSSVELFDMIDEVCSKYDYIDIL